MFVAQKIKYDESVRKGRGSADCLIIGNGEMVVIDLKYGAGLAVSAENNPQLRLCDLGCLPTYDCIYDISTVTMHIVQQTSAGNYGGRNCRKPESTACLKSDKYKEISINGVTAGLDNGFADESYAEVI